MTVTSIDISGSQGITSTGGPITSSGTINVGLGAITPTSVAATSTISGTDFTSSGNLNFSLNAQRITGDMNSSTSLNRLAFQNSVTDGSTAVMAIPNGTSNNASFTVQNRSSTEAAGVLNVGITNTESYIQSSRRNSSGTSLPLNFKTGNVPTTRLSIDVSGNITASNNLTVNGTVNVGTPSLGSKIIVQGGTTSGAEFTAVNSSNSGILALDSGNATDPVSIYISDYNAMPSIELVGSTPTNPGEICLTNIPNNLVIYLTSDLSTNEGTASVRNNNGGGGVSISGGVHNGSFGGQLVAFNADESSTGFTAAAGDGVSTPATCGVNGPGLNGNISLISSNNLTGDSAARISGNSYSGTNNVSLDIVPQNDGKINITNLNIATKFSTSSSVSGNITLTSGTATVWTNAVNANSVILLTVGTLGTVTTPQPIHWSNKVTGTSFDIVSANNTDTSTVSWLIIG